MDINTFIDNSKNFNKIREALIDDDSFRSFAAALGLKSSETYSLIKKDDRVWLALRTWTKQTHTVDELRTILLSLGYRNLVASIFGSPQTQNLGEEFGVFKNWMCNQLTISNKESILMSMGLPAGECETNALSNNAFIATLVQYAVIDSSNHTLDVTWFKNYPNIVKKYQQFKGDNVGTFARNDTFSHIGTSSRNDNMQSGLGLGLGSASMSLDVPAKQESIVSLGSKRVENLATWINGANNDPAYTMITALMDRHKVWYELLAHYDLLCSESVADLVTKLESMRTGQTQKVFALIAADGDLGSKSLADFSADLKAISAEFPKLIEEIKIWDSDRAAEAKKIRDDNKRTYELSRGLRKILIDDLRVATSSNVNDIIAKLTGPSIGLRDISKIYLIDKASLIAAGFTAFDAAIMSQQFSEMGTGLSRNARASLDAASSSFSHNIDATSSIPPGPTSAIVRTTISTTVMSE